MRKALYLLIGLLSIQLAINFYDLAQLEKDLKLANETIEVQDAQIKALQQELLAPYLRENDEENVK